MNKILLYVNVALILTVSVLSYWLNNVREEKKRLADNQEALLSDVDYYKTESGKSAASVLKLELSKSELENHCQDLTKTIDDLNIKIGRIQSVSTTVTKTEVEIQTVVRDSIVYRDLPVNLKVVKWRDPWVTLNGVLDGETFSAKIESVDTLSQVVHRIPKKFLFIKWGTKAIRQEVVSSNPHSKIVYTEYIELKGRKRK
ncbi:hypothetical protein PO081_16830 [Bacteroides thetaiotaomicron]|uniref:DUF6549 family protein n=1 Tax=Bacteroides thetaiotaomicron TaxID=818 RepID=UPI00232D5D8A|nr:DUF6549 family protein [Bacteroides thetaiotaomicron]MDC2194947.1 hypothetical protein [Bacteroides thetaiotaomicron]